MKREFTNKEVKNLSEEIQNKLNQIDKFINDLSIYQNAIKDSVNLFIKVEASKIINATPIDELARAKEGIRIKTLKDSNINYIGDIFRVSEKKLESIKGISKDGARRIKEIATDMFLSTKKEIRIKLSVDNIEKYSTNIILAVSKYKDYLEFVSECKKLKHSYKDEIISLLEDIKPSQNSFKWLFSSRDKKDNIIISYDKLCKLNDGEFGQGYNELLATNSKIINKSVEACWDDFSLNNIKFFNIIEEFCPGVLGSNDVLYGLPDDLAKEIASEPLNLEGFNGTLRKYQELGAKYILHQKRVLLGDEMGLGKTIQAIACMVSLSNSKARYFIVVCPASVVINWCREVHKFSPLKAYLIHGENKTKNIKEWAKNGGVAVVNYESIQFLNSINIKSYDMLIVDEAHYAKNPDAQRTLNVKRLCQKTKRVLFMTGTALENRVDEMVNLIEMLNVPIAQNINKIAYMATAEEFRMKVAPVYYRRKKDDVLTELPDLIETKEWCSLNKEEEKIYEENVLSKQIMTARRLSWNVNDLTHSSKASRLKEIVEEAEEDNRKIIIYSFFLDTISKIKEFLGSRCSEPINGSVPLDKRQLIIDEFSKSTTETVLLCQIQAGGTGLNIQSASVIVFCEPQYKPSIENQAIARAYRMGQSRNVLVYRLLCEDTIDERITEILEEKSKIFDAFADDSVAAQSCEEIDSKTVSKILDDEIERINNKNNNNIKNEVNTEVK